MTHHAPPSAQRGVALLALLVMLMLAGGYAFYRSSNLGGTQNQERDTVLQRLARAKEAVIAYAVNDATRPGRLLCPDLIDDGNSPMPPYDCEAYGGWLPWKTLDLPENTDAQGGHFRFHITPAFGGKNSNTILNSETATTLRLDVPVGNSSNDIAAVIIATRGAPDARNADGDDYFFNHDRSNALSQPDDNDIVIAITRQELMAAVEQRIANELRTCLEQHSNSPDNVQKAFPWPAPLSNSIFKGVEDSLFGMVADTQPGNPDVALKDAIAKLTLSKNSLIFPSTVAAATTQAANLQQLQQVAAYARQLFDRLYTVALALNISALNTSQQFNTLDETLASATVNKSVFTPLAGTLPGAIASALPGLTTLQEALGNSGFDIFLSELQAQNATLAAALEIASAAPSASNLTKVLTTVNELNNRLLNFASTPNPDIETKIGAAFTASGIAAFNLNAAKKTLDQPAIDSALISTQDLYNRNQTLATAIISIKDVAFRAEDITVLQKVLSTSDTAATRAQLSTTLNAAKTLVNSLNSGTALMTTTRAASLLALDNALNAAAGVDSTAAAILASATQATLALNQLAQALNDNVALESLKTLGQSLTSATLQAPANVTSARSLRTPVKAVIYWSDIAAYQADKIATQARRGIINGVPTQEDSDNSAYTAASRLLNSLDGETGSMTRLDKYLANPSDSLLADANAALATTQGLLNTLLTAAQQLDSSLSSSMAAAALPTVWYSKACAFLAAPTGSKSWWATNAWNTLFFYQISEHIRPTVGQLSINGTGSYLHVVLAAGRRAWSYTNAPCEWKTQDPGTIPKSTATYLENGNSHPSRDGDAKTPIKTFTSGPLKMWTDSDLEALGPACQPPPTAKRPIITFNDRLAH
ncbi:MAG: hypothetical protein HGA71_04140 [Azonexaceae bacterium]|nr:hypothetical protein [Azonexaceae bacterium]